MAWRTYNICAGTKIQCNLDFSPQSVNWWAVITDDLGLTLYQDAGTLSALLLEGTLPAGTYSTIVRVWDDISQTGDATLYEIVINVLSECSVPVDVCCEGTELRWLTQQGGIQNYFFKGVRTIEVRTDDSETFVNSNRQIQFSKKGRTARGKILTADNIGKAVADMLDGCRFSIQAWIIESGTALPILIDSGSFIKYKTRDKFYKTSLRFQYADQVRIQTQ